MIRLKYLLFQFAELELQLILTFYISIYNVFQQNKILYPIKMPELCMRS